MNQIAGRLGLFAFIGVIIAQALTISGAITRQSGDLVFGIAFATMVIPFFSKIGLSLRAAVGMCLALIGIVLIAWTTMSDIRFMPYLAVVLINAAVAYVFLRGQLPGHTPVILQLINLINIAPVGSPTFRRFIYWQCWAWVGFGGITSIVGVVAMTTPEFSPLAGKIIVGLMVAQIAWFILSHRYANRRYKRPETWRDTIRAMARPAIWDELTI